MRDNPFPARSAILVAAMVRATVEDERAEREQPAYVLRPPPSIPDEPLFFGNRKERRRMNAGGKRKRKW